MYIIDYLLAGIGKISKKKKKLSKERGENNSLIHPAILIALLDLHAFHIYMELFLDWIK